MTIRPRAVRALRDVRERLRDAAAASHAEASHAREASGAALADSHRELEAFLDDASDTLAEARHVNELDRVAEHTGVHRLAIADASARHAAATRASEATAGALRERTRQLRTAEKLIEMIDDHLSKREAHAEQRHHDDMSGRRR